MTDHIERQPSAAEETLPIHDPDHPDVQRARRRHVDRELIRLRRIVTYLFVLLVFAMLSLSVWQQLNANRIEYERYDLCQQRNAEITLYNDENAGTAPTFPMAYCGPDPRTD